MSCNNWERGTITIPTKEWAKFRTALITAWNARQTGYFTTAKLLHAQLKDDIKGKRGSTRQKALVQALERRCPEHHEDNSTVRDMVVSCKWEGGKRTYELKGQPKKKDAQILPTSKDADLHLDEAGIYLRNKGRTVTWDVSENNRAVERANDHPIAKKLFRLLDSITWTRGTGGEIVGNDEYNQDNRDSGGGGN